MCQYMSHTNDGKVQPWHEVNYGVLARGGAGLAMVEATGVLPEGRITPRCLGLWSDDQIAGLSRIADFAHSNGAKIGIQLNHAGRKASTYEMFPNVAAGSVPISEGGWSTIAPSAVAFDNFYEPSIATVDEMDRIVEAFRAAAARATAAGFDVIEIHSAHGYLLHELLSPISNRRDDEYGGSLENRARLHRRILRSIKADQPEAVIFVRISASEWVEDGFDVDETVKVSTWFAQDGADLIDISSGGNVPVAPIPVRPSYQVPLAQAVKANSPIPVGVAGLITQASQAESILTTGQADVICIGREALRDPQFAHKWAKELRADSNVVPAPLWRGYL